MDKDKSEKLKEILNQRLSNEDIHEKLKKEQDQFSQNKKIENNQVSIEEKNENIKEPILNNEKIEKQETIIIPSVRNEKKEEDKESNLLLYLVAIIALLLLIFTIYLFKRDTLFNEKLKEPKITETTIKEIKQPETEIKKILKKEIPEILENEKIDEKAEEKKVTNQVSKVKENNQLAIKKEEEKVLENKSVNQVDQKPKEAIKIKEIIKEKIVTKTINLEKEDFKKYYNSSKYNTLKCYNFKAGDIFPDSKCKNDLQKFLNTNKNALRFEVIPVIAEDDNIIFDKMQNNIKDMKKEFQDRVKEYMFRGLGRERVLETSWQIKDILGEDTVLTPTNYYVNSKKNNKGIIIKAYY